MKLSTKAPMLSSFSSILFYITVFVIIGTSSVSAKLCKLCRWDGSFPGKPNTGVVVLPGYMPKTQYTCEELYYAGLNDEIPEKMCGYVGAFLEKPCGCGKAVETTSTWTATGHGPNESSQKWTVRKPDDLLPAHLRESNKDDSATNSDSNNSSNPSKPSTLPSVDDNAKESASSATTGESKPSPWTTWNRPSSWNTNGKQSDSDATTSTSSVDQEDDSTASNNDNKSSWYKPSWKAPTARDEHKTSNNWIKPWNNPKPKDETPSKKSSKSKESKSSESDEEFSSKDSSEINKKSESTASDNKSWSAPSWKSLSAKKQDYSSNSWSKSWDNLNGLPETPDETPSKKSSKYEAATDLQAESSETKVKGGKTETAKIKKVNSWSKRSSTSPTNDEDQSANDWIEPWTDFADQPQTPDETSSKKSSKSKATSGSKSEKQFSATDQPSTSSSCSKGMMRQY